MSVVFSNILGSLSADVIVIVSHSSGLDFIEKKIREVVEIDLPDNILKKIEKLDYKSAYAFDLPVKDKLVSFVVVGAGKKEDLTRASVEKLGGYIYDNLKSKDLEILLNNNIESVFDDAASMLVSGMQLKSWTFDKYKTKKNNSKIKAIKCITSYAEINENSYKKLEVIDNCVFLTRKLVTEPANIMNPDAMLEEAEDLKKYGVKVNSLDKKDMAKLGMNALLGVGLGSDQPSYLITMEYRSDKSKPTIALVGKGLTFDSGGVCLKPSAKMSEMKGDMAGAAVVIGALKAIAMLDMDVNVVGVIGVVENMISGSAQRPGDVVTSMSGKTIEIDNTDAEGRLVLADAIWYTQEKYNPDIIVDIATLTGAIQVALGHEFAGVFSNSSSLTEKLIKSGTNVGEKLWELPLSPSYDEDVKSDIADIKNTGAGRGAGSITAAIFLKNFVKDSVKWAHLDIAATEWDSKSRALSQKGATGFGVRLISDFVKEFYCKSARLGD